MEYKSQIKNKKEISSNVFSKEIYNIKKSQYFPISNVFYFIYFQIFINTLLVFFAIIFNSLTSNFKFIMYFILTYNFLCVLFQFLFLLCLKKKIRSKNQDKEKTYKKLNLSFSERLIFKIFFSLKIFFDFIAFYCMKNTDINNSRLLIDEVLFEYLNKIILFLMFFNANLFQNIKYYITKKISLRITYLIVILIFFVVSILFF